MWTPNGPISQLPQKIRDYFQEQSYFLKKDLEESKLKIVLIPAPEQKHNNHMIRTVETTNPGWYSELYHETPHFRRDRSLRSLTRILTLNDKHFNINPYKYDSIYRELIKEQLINGYELEEYFVPENKEVYSFFLKE